MTFKRFVQAVLIAGLVLLIEFKAVPWLYQKIRYGGSETVTPYSEVEKIRYQLVDSLSAQGFRLNSGPFIKGEDGFETVLAIRGKDVKVIFSTEKNVDTQLASLQLILKEATIEESFQTGNPPQLIDLTGNKPYVSF